MAVDCFYGGFEVVRLDANGNRLALPGEDVDLYNVTQAVLIDTLTADDDGWIEAGGFDSAIDDAASGDVVEVQHATYTETHRFTLQSTADLAARKNKFGAYVVENLATVNTPTTATIMAADDDEPNKKPFKVGEAIVDGPAFLWPFTTPLPKNYTLYLAPSETESKASLPDVTRSPSEALTVPGTSVRPLFDEYTDATTTGTATEALYTYSLPLATMTVNGDKVSVEYAGEFAANANSKRLVLEMFGNQLFDETFTDNNVDWEIEATAIRVSNTVVRCQGTATVDGVTCKVTYAEYTALNLTTTAYDILLRGRTSDNAGDLTARMGYGIFIPAAPVDATAYDLTFLGDTVTFLGDTVTFTP